MVTIITFLIVYTALVMIGVIQYGFRESIKLVTISFLITLLVWGLENLTSYLDSLLLGL